ncbi:hypothetical protein CSHISOI_08604 [Colletotrichum shisoi]|uniref:Uncharacterized protein n=1 Tax=Colletotrichum shisoi TaxID=2078593 RepID=A0A5Q4BIT5_9PEZI|nr:hypothetical protein CSHISOI_08604 [Colletotrichum shisoi]
MEPKTKAPLDMAMSDPINLSLSLSLSSLWTDSGLGTRADADAGYGFCPCHTLLTFLQSTAGQGAAGLLTKSQANGNRCLMPRRGSPSWPRIPALTPGTPVPTRRFVCSPTARGHAARFRSSGPCPPSPLRKEDTAPLRMQKTQSL